MHCAAKKARGHPYGAHSTQSHVEKYTEHKSDGVSHLLVLKPVVLIEKCVARSGVYTAPTQGDVRAGNAHQQLYVRAYALPFSSRMQQSEYTPTSDTFTPE